MGLQITASCHPPSMLPQVLRFTKMPLMGWNWSKCSTDRRCVHFVHIFRNCFAYFISLKSDWLFTVRRDCLLPHIIWIKVDKLKGKVFKQGYLQGTGKFTKFGFHWVFFKYNYIFFGNFYFHILNLWKGVLSKCSSSSTSKLCSQLMETTCGSI